eukprot:TRINITY_DN4997_c0_g6_i1.p2 TRINITY_DN4997_c0_g6~~TRINITY_DN4997_c0_g6_i1.p2  ORF type:complete len:193 (-),score=-15.60 TRINITY_DN4997_c0_g6_i1:59-637(-)
MYVLQDRFIIYIKNQRLSFTGFAQYTEIQQEQKINNQVIYLTNKIQKNYKNLTAKEMKCLFTESTQITKKLFKNFYLQCLKLGRHAPAPLALAPVLAPEKCPAPVLAKHCLLVLVQFFVQQIFKMKVPCEILIKCHLKKYFYNYFTVINSTTKIQSYFYLNSLVQFSLVKQKVTSHYSQSIVSSSLQQLVIQ